MSYELETLRVEVECLRKANDVIISDLQSCQAQNETLRAKVDTAKVNAALARAELSRKWSAYVNASVHLKEEVERLRAREQVMREALEAFIEAGKDSPIIRGYPHAVSMGVAALAPDAGNTITVLEAQNRNVCRICEKPANPTKGNPILLYYGEEYAHANCISDLAAKAALAPDAGSTLSAEVERLQKQNRVMRDFFVYLKPQIEKDGIPEVIDSLDLVLSEEFDGGSDLLTRDDVNPLIDALKNLVKASCCFDVSKVMATGPCPRCKAIEALAHARTLGFK